MDPNPNEHMIGTITRETKSSTLPTTNDESPFQILEDRIDYLTEDILSLKDAINKTVNMISYKSYNEMKMEGPVEDKSKKDTVQIYNRIDRVNVTLIELHDMIMDLKITNEKIQKVFE